MPSKKENKTVKKWGMTHLSNKFDLMSYKNRSKYWFTKTEIISLVLSRYKFLFGDISNLIKSKAFKIAFNFSFLT